METKSSGFWALQRPETAEIAESDSHPTSHHSANLTPDRNTHAELLWKARNFEWRFPRPALIMGVVNLSPDSFSGDGLYGFATKDVLRRVEQMLIDGAEIVDVGAVSTRPGAQPVSEEEELTRLIPYLKAIRENFDVPISVDTTRASVAEEALKLGCHIINDVSGLRFDPVIARVVAKYSAGLILMHSRGTPENMQTLTNYDNLIEDIASELGESIALAEKMGLDSDAVAIDPGLGFAKKFDQNYEIVANLESFHRFGRPVLIGPSRKSFIGAVTNKSPQERICGTAAVCALAVSKGVHILRVHDVSEIRDAVRVAEEVMKHVAKIRHCEEAPKALTKQSTSSQIASLATLARNDGRG